jgi:hypothetical protein
MGTVYKETSTKPLPAGAKIIVRKGQRLAQRQDAKGKGRKKNRGLGSLFFIETFQGDEPVATARRTPGIGSLRTRCCHSTKQRLPTPGTRHKNVSEQLNVVDRIESLSVETQRMESIYQQKLAALDALKKSLLHRAFSGELTRDCGSRHARCL